METDETMTKAKWPLETGLAVGNALLERLRGHCVSVTPENQCQ